jgi:hypothetical protein
MEVLHARVRTCKLLYAVEAFACTVACASLVAYLHACLHARRGQGRGTIVVYISILIDSRDMLTICPLRGAWDDSGFQL